MLGQLNEKKVLIYFASGLRLNGVDNQAQMRATINAAIRANVSFYPIDARGLVAQAPLGDATQGSPGGVGMYSGARRDGVSDQLPAVAGHAVRAGRRHRRQGAARQQRSVRRASCNAQKAISSYYIIGYYTTNTDARRQVPQDQDHAART